MLNVIFVYLIEAFAIALAAYYIPKRILNIGEILKIAITGAITHLLLDLYSPLVSTGLRVGTGMTMGKNMVNNPVSILGGKKGGDAGDQDGGLCHDICGDDHECFTVCEEAFRE